MPIISCSLAKVRVTETYQKTFRGQEVLRNPLLFYCIAFDTYPTEILFDFYSMHGDIEYRIHLLLFLYCMWLVSRGNLLLLLSIVCVLYSAKSNFYRLNTERCLHFAPFRIFVLLILHCVSQLFYLQYIWLY